MGGMGFMDGPGWAPANRVYAVGATVAKFTYSTANCDS